MKNFQYHEVTEKEKKDIKKQAKKILDEFSSSLDKVETKEMHFENGDGTRQEEDGWELDEEFRSTAFANAPFIDDDFFVAEKGGWK